MPVPPLVTWRGVSHLVDPDEICDDLARECITRTGLDPLEVMSAVFKGGSTPCRMPLARLWWLVVRSHGGPADLSAVFASMTPAESRTVTVVAAPPEPPAPVGPVMLPPKPVPPRRPAAPSVAVESWPWLRVQLRDALPALSMRFGLRPDDIDGMRPSEARRYTSALEQLRQQDREDAQRRR